MEEFMLRTKQRGLSDFQKIWNFRTVSNKVVGRKRICRPNHALDHL